MSTKRDLSTAEGILRYCFGGVGCYKHYQSNADDGLGCDHYDHGCLGCRENTETAAYLAECVRLKMAFDADCAADATGNDLYTVSQSMLLSRLRNAMKGSGK